MTEQPALIAVPTLLSVANACQVLGCSPRTIRRRIAAGELPAVLDHGRLMIRGDELKAYIDTLERYGPAQPHHRRRPARRHHIDFLAD